MELLIDFFCRFYRPNSTIFQILTILILNYHYRLASSHEMPRVIRFLFLEQLPWLLRMSRPGDEDDRESAKLNNKLKALDRGDPGPRPPLRYSSESQSRNGLQLWCMLGDVVWPLNFVFDSIGLQLGIFG